MVSRVVPGAYPGMVVKVFEERQVAKESAKEESDTETEMN